MYNKASLLFVCLVNCMYGDCFERSLVIPFVSVDRLQILKRVGSQVCLFVEDVGGWLTVLLQLYPGWAWVQFFTHLLRFLRSILDLVLLGDRLMFLRLYECHHRGNKSGFSMTISKTLLINSGKYTTFCTVRGSKLPEADDSRLWTPS